MTPTLSLRIAAGLTMLHAILHTVGGVFGKPTESAQEAALAVMKSSHFPMMGNDRTYWDFYFGFGLFVSVALAVESVVFWQLAALATSNTVRLRPILWPFVAGYLAYAIISSVYFFAPPAIFEVLIAALIGLAIAKSR